MPEEHLEAGGDAFSRRGGRGVAAGWDQFAVNQAKFKARRRTRRRFLCAPLCVACLRFAVSPGPHSGRGAALGRVSWCTSVCGMLKARAALPRVTWAGVAPSWDAVSCPSGQTPEHDAAPRLTRAGVA